MAKSLKKTETFALEAAEAARVQLVGDFSEWEQQPINLKKQKNGVWKATIPLLPGPHEYRFLVDGQWQDDPQCAARVPNPFGASNCVRNVE